MDIKIVKYDSETEELKLLAVFRLRKKKVKAEWYGKSDSLKHNIERNGVATGNGLFFMKDGKDFMDNLLFAYAQSSFVSAVEIKKDHKPKLKTKSKKDD